MPKPSNNKNAKILSGAAQKNVLTRLLKMVFSLYPTQLIIVAVCLLFGALAGTSSSIFLNYLVENCIEPVLQGVKTYADVKPTIMTCCGIMCGIYAIGVSAFFLYTRLMAIVSQNFLARLRKQMFDKMESLPIKYFDRNTHGDLMSYYTNDIDTIRQLVSDSLPHVCQSFVVVVVVFFVMVYFSLWLTIIVVGMVVLMSIIAKKLGGSSGKYFVRQQKSIARVEGYIEEMMTGQKVVKVFCHEDEAIEGFDKRNEELFGNADKAHTYANILMPIMGNMGNILYVALAFVGSVLAIGNAPNVSLQRLFNPEDTAVSLATIVSFLHMGKMFSNNVSQISQQVNAVVMALAGADRVFSMIDEEPETDEGYVELVNAKYDENGELTETKERTSMWAWRHPHKADGTVTYTLLKGDIEMHDVDFGYVPDKIVLHDVSLHAKPGEKYAFVGATGAGKTTITNLINRFYDIADGKIRYDGININKIKKSDLRRSLGMVLQDTNLFTGTVRENIRYGRLDATDEEVIEAAKIANAHDFIMRLPKGYDTLLESDGSNLSQGQRQLLSIARAAVADAPVMIMDEATSSIDTRTERLVQDGTDRLMQGRTVFVIAHRLSTVQNADTIVVLDHGRVIERGTHDELIALGGQYYQLYTGAFELE